MEKAGRVNEYVCDECGCVTRTINAVDGVTPYMIRCRPVIPGTCDGMAQSRMYAVSQSDRPRFEWYRPCADELAEMDDAVKTHVQNGGLLLRRVRHETLEEFGFGLRAG